MSDTDTRPTEFSDNAPRVTKFRRFCRVFFARGLVVFGLSVTLLLFFAAITAEYIAPYDPYEIDLGNALVQPSSEHWLGTDALGRDTLSRIIYGTRTSLMVGFVAIGIGATVGMALGLLAGYYRGLVYLVIMRFMDALIAFPLIILALVLAALLGGGLKNVMIAIGVGLAPAYARLMCGVVLSVRENDFIIAGRAMGSSDLRIMLYHVLPNCFPPLIVLITMMMGTTILAEAGLSFLGIGIDPPGAAWGAMVSDGYRYLLTNPILSFGPGIAIILVVFAFNMVGDGLRDALDPRLRGTL